MLFLIPKIICVIITRTLFVSPCYLAVSDPALLRVERIKYLSCLAGSVVLRAAAGLGVAADLGVAVVVVVYCGSCLVVP